MPTFTELCPVTTINWVPEVVVECSGSSPITVLRPRRTGWKPEDPERWEAMKQFYLVSPSLRELSFSCKLTEAESPDIMAITREVARG